MDRGPLKAALQYFLFGFAWILASDTLVLVVFEVPDAVARAQTLKGWVYVLLTTGLVWLLTRRYLHEKDAALRESLAHSASVTAALEEKSLLLRELHHRVKNSLQMVVALLGIGEAEDDLDATRRRVHALAASHELGVESPHLSEIELGTFVRELVERELTPTPSAVEVAGTCRVPLAHTVPIGILVVELSTTAQSLAATSAGRLEIHLDESPDRVRVSIVHPWCDSLSARLSPVARTLCDALTGQIGGGWTSADGVTTISLAPRGGSGASSERDADR